MSIALNIFFRTALWVLAAGFFFQASAADQGRVELSADKVQIQALRETIESLVEDPQFSTAHIGIYIESLDEGSVVYEHDSEKLFIPASNMKIFTTAAALKNLGPDFRYVTPVMASGEIDNHELKGDLIVRGGGDPSISARFHNGDPLAVFRQWADRLKRMGLKRINGDLVGDASLFNGNGLGRGWNWDDESYWYAAKSSALSFNDNCLDVKAAPGARPGDPVKVELIPETGYAVVDNQAKTLRGRKRGGLSVDRVRGKNLIEIKGGLGVGARGVTMQVTVEDPALFFMDALARVLRDSGIEIRGRVRLGRARTNEWARTLFTHNSPPLYEIIKVVNEKSHNLYAELLLKTMGARIGHDGRDKVGAGIVSRWMRSLGVPGQEFVMYDGSGLSRMNLVSPRAAAALLRAMYQDPDFEYFYQSLPRAGIEGSIRRRMRGTRAQGNVRAKMGYVTHNICLSGYVRDMAGKPYAFVIMANNYSGPPANFKGLQDEICIRLSEFRG